MNSELLPDGNQLVTAVLNGTAQGILLVLFVGLGLRLSGRLNAATRHAIWRFTLLLLALLLPANYFRPGERDSSARKEPAVLRTRTLPEPLPASPEDAAIGAGVAASDLPTEGPSEESNTPETTSPVRGRIAEQSPLVPPATGWRFPWRSRDLVSRVPRTVSLGLILAWLAVAAARAVLLVRNLWLLRRLKARSVLAEGQLAEVFDGLRGQMSVHRNVRLALSPAQSGAAVLGFFRPLIVLPDRSVSESNLRSMEGILRHELAHVRRWDDWSALQLQLVQVALFFHPGVWWISRQMSIEREIACDDCVLHAGGPARDYALLLLESARDLKESGLRLAPGASNNRSQLHQRIDMILKPHRNTSPRLAKGRLGFITSAAALLAALTVCTGPRLVLAGLPGASEIQQSPALAADDATPAPALASAEAPDASTPADVGSGPKTKTAPSISLAAPVAPTPAAPEPPSSMSVSSSPKPRHRRDSAGPDREARLEARIDRLEKMVESLAAQQTPKHPRDHANFNMSEDQSRMLNDKELGEMKELAARSADRMAEEAKRMVEQTKRIAKQAQEEVARAADQAKRGLADAYHYQNKLADERDISGKALKGQLEGLQKQRDALQHQMERLQRQIERLQRHQDDPKAKDPFDGGPNKPNSGSNDSQPPKAGF